MAFDDKDSEDLPITERVLGEIDANNQQYLQFIEARGAKGISPLSQEGLEIQAEYLKTLGDNAHPFDVLRRISINPFAPLKDRIQASKTLLEYMLRKVPAAIELTGANGQALLVSQEALRNLSASDLDLLAGILERANKGMQNGQG